MAMFVECDVCKRRMENFRNVAITRKQLSPAAGSKGFENVQEKMFSFDVCSDTCEARAVAQILARVVPLAANMANSPPPAWREESVEVDEPMGVANPDQPCYYCGTTRGNHEAGKTTCSRFRSPPSSL